MDQRLLIGFGVKPSLATLAVLGYRTISYWLSTGVLRAGVQRSVVADLDQRHPDEGAGDIDG